MGDRPTGTVTFLFTDIEGSTRLWQDEPQAMGRALERHDLLLRSCIEDRGGYVFKTVGDAFCAAFQSAQSAVNAAIALQLAIKEEEWPQEASIGVRTALHSGEAFTRDGDYFGVELSRIGRLLSAGHGGQILVSGATKGLVQNHLPDDTALRPMGTHRLRDLSQTEDVYQLDHKHLEDEFPALKTLRNLPNNLPQQLTSFVGRGEELVELERLFKGTKLLTLTGVGGTGKTRLALQFAADQLDRFMDGVWLVELASLNDPDLVPGEVAQALKIKEEGDRAMTETLVTKLRDKNLVVLLDNCEHLRDSCADLAVALLRHCPNLKIIASSREAIGVPGEQVLRVLSLPTPELGTSAEDLMKIDSVALFSERARLVRPTFTVSDDNAVAVASVCNKLDGIPLAIELAAARVGAMSVAQVNERLDQKFRLLTGGAKSALKRQQTLRGLIDWSYDLLNDKEKSLLRRLSVFRNGWTMAVAEEVCSDDLIDEHEILDLLTSLVEKSLAIYEAERYWMLETVREYAAERLAQESESKTWRDSHLVYFAKLAEEAEPELRGKEYQSWFDVLDAELDNLRAALDWASASQAGSEAGLRTVGFLVRFWFIRCYFTEGRLRLESALSLSTDKSTSRARALSGAGSLAHGQLDFGPAARYLEESLEIYQELGDQSGCATCLDGLGIVAFEQGDYAAAQDFHKKALAIFRSQDAPAGIGSSLNGLANTARGQGDYSAARMLYEESLAMFEEADDEQNSTAVLANLGILAFHQDDFEDSCKYLTLGLARCIATGDQRDTAGCIDFLAFVKFGNSRPTAAARLCGAAEALREGIGLSMPPADRDRYGQNVAAVREALGDDAFDTAWNDGRAMSLADAVELALSEEGNV